MSATCAPANQRNASSNVPDHERDEKSVPSRARHRGPNLKSVLGSLWGQLTYDLKSQVRNPSATFFTLALPLLFLLAFGMTNDDPSAAAEYYVPSIMILAIASGTFTNLAVTLTYLREFGQLKRILVTPLPVSAYLGSRVLAGAGVALLTVIILGLVGYFAFEVSPSQPVILCLAVVMTVAVGSALGLAVTAFIRSETAAAPLANAISLPLLLVSGVFFPLASMPDWVERVSGYLPFTALVAGATGAYEGEVTRETIVNMLVYPSAWIVLGVLVIWKGFSFSPMKRR